MPGGYTSHDLTHHVIRQISMDKLLSEGQFPPRWSGELNNGFGYPVFLFNYPLPALIGEVFHKLGLGFVDSVKAVLFLGLIGSALGMYLFLKAWLKDDWSAFLGSIFYLYAPIRFINTYVSASVGSSLAMAIVPFVFWSMVTGRVLTGALFFALLILAHNVTALIFAPLMLTFALVYVRKKEIIWMFLLGLGLSAWFWLPAIFETQYIRYSSVVGKVYLDQFPSLKQLIYSPWGFGLSHPETSGGMSYQVGLIQWLVVLLALLFLKKRAFYALFFFFLSIFLMLKVSLPIWDNSALSLVQYPFRLLAISVFSASILAAMLVKRKKVFIFLIILVLYANRNHLGINQPFNPGEDYYLQLKTTTTTHGEHLPKWGSVALRQAQGKLEFTEGKGKIEYQKDTSGLVIANIESSKSGKLRFNQYYFPGWEFKINDQKVKFDYLHEGENYGLPVLEAPSGKSVVLAQFENTPDRTLADIISILSTGLWLVLLAGYAVKRINHSVTV